MTESCEECKRKDERITYLNALIALNHIQEKTHPVPTQQNVDLVKLQQRQEVLKRQLLIIRADVQYLNREVKNVFEWILKVISVFLSCCGRISETTASLVVASASDVGKEISRIIGK